MKLAQVQRVALALMAGLCAAAALPNAHAETPYASRTERLVAQSTGKSRPEFKGLYMGMPASELPASLQKTGGIGQYAGFVGDDYVEAFVWYGVLSQLSIVYHAPALDQRPRIDRRLTLEEAWRLHSAGDGVPEFGFWLTHLYLVDGLIDARSLIAYRLQFPHRRYGRDDPPLFDPQTRVERVIYYKDRPDLASNYQPIDSKPLLKLIGERYHDAFVR